MTNYPDYTWAGDPCAPWNQEDLPNCIHEDECDHMKDGYMACPSRGACDWYDCGKEN